MRVDTLKYLFLGVHDERDLFFERAQEAGIIQFIDMEPGRHHEPSGEADAVVLAIKALRSLPPVDQEETEEYALADDMVHKINALKTELDKLNEEERILGLEIARVGVFGNFSLKEIAEIEQAGKCKIQFYCAKAGFSHEGIIPERAIFVATAQGLEYYVAINDEPTQFESMIEMQIDRPLQELKSRLKIVYEEIHAVTARIKSYAKYHNFLHKAYFFKLDSHNLAANKHYVTSKMEGELFAVEGWVPATRLDEMEQLVKQMHVVADPIAIEEVDVAPTCLENAGFHRIGEDLVNIYDTPSNKDKDPSLWVLCWFSLFFAMIIGDAGYGLLFLAVALYIRYRNQEMKPTGKRVWKLFTLLSVCCIAWGFLINSFFGVALSPDNVFREYSMTTWLSEKKIAYNIAQKNQAYKEAIQRYPQLSGVEDAPTFLKKGVRLRDGEEIHELADNTANGIMMEIALLIGAVHVILGLARYMGRNLAAIGWIIFIIGGVLYIPIYLKVPSMVNYVLGIGTDLTGHDGKILMGLGFTLACGLSLYQHKLLGIFEPMAVIQIFADILSYLRLYALGLAGAIVGVTVNGFAEDAGPILAIIPLVIGHLINIVLAIMGGVIHGLRLNFLEWYHYSFEGGGKRYNPLRKLAKELV